jgi:DNA helicase-2/ATP-dependent DNA helicase PcrA
MASNRVDPLKDLNEPQKQAVLTLEGPLLIVAGAGAGKTKTITNRIAHLMSTGIAGNRILALTFTNKAANEMRERVKKLLPEHHGPLPLLTTFHALGARLLREFHQEAGVARGFVIWDRDDSIRAIKKITKDLGQGDAAPRSFLSGISRRKGEGISAQMFAESASSYREKTLAEVWLEYEKVLAEEDALDFDDLLLRTLRLLQTRTDVLGKLQNRWTHITIDEYQDTNVAQFEIARLLAGPRRNICVVGDGDQLVYSWRGADIENLLSFETIFPGTKVVLLEQNYRSTRTILAAANAVIAKNVRRKEKNLFTENETGDPIHFAGSRNEVEEAWHIAEQIRNLIDGSAPRKVLAGEIAILYRENFQSRVLEEALLRYSIPYRVLGVRFFERAEVKDLLSYLRAARNPKSKADLSRIVATPPRGIGKTTLDKMLAGDTLTGAAGEKVQKFRDTLAKIKHGIETLPASEAVRYAAEASGIQKMLEADDEEGKERLGNIYELVNLAVRYDDQQCPEGIERLLEEAALQSEQDSLNSSADRAAVSLMTVHASKGLEFDAVFVTGLEQGLFPSTRESDPSTSLGAGRDNEEERRLFYVAMTRARKKLFLSYAHERMKYGAREPSLPSEFFDDIDDRLMVAKPRKRGLLDDWSDVIR